VTSVATAPLPPPPPPPPLVAAAAQPPRHTPPRWGTQTGFIQRHQPAFWLFVVLLAVGVTWGLGEQVREIQKSFGGWVVGWLLLMLYIVPAALIIRWLDTYEKEPRSMLIAAFVWGFFGATVFAFYSNTFWGVVVTKVAGAQFAFQWSAAATAPVVEESYKYIGLVMLFLIARAEFDDLIDGFVYGATIGLGFAVAEDLLYFILKGGGSIVEVVITFVLRVVFFGIYSHYLYTGISGIGLAYFVSGRGKQPFNKRFLVAAGLLLLAMVAHFTWNSPWLLNLNDPGATIVGLTFKGLPFLVALIVLLRLAHKREDDALADALTGETGKLGLTAREMELLRDRKSRRRAVRRVREAAGSSAAELLKNVQRAQIKLALVATAVESPDSVALIRQREACHALRAQLWQYPGAAAALGETSDPVTPLPLDVSDQFMPNAVVVPSGAWAVPAPNWNDSRRLALPPGLALQVVEQRAPWALTRSANGWVGWTDQQYLQGAPTG
jgi:protease PrsW